MVHRIKKLEKFIKEQKLEEQKKYKMLDIPSFSKKSAENFQKVLKHEKIPSKIIMAFPFTWDIKVMRKDEEKALEIRNDFYSLSKKNREKYLKMI